MESLDQEFASKPASSNGLHAPAHPEDHFPPDVPFGSGTTQVVPHEWAAWILTQMREDEIAGRKPRPFSAWIGACVLEHR